MNPIPNDGQPQNDDIDNDDEELSDNQANQKFMPTYGISKPQSQFALYPNPNAANFNIPPLILQTLQDAAAAPPPPFPLLSSTNPLNFNSMPMPMPMSNENNVENAYNKPILNDPVDAQSEEHTDEPSQPTELPNSVPIAQKPIDTVKAYRPVFLFGNPLYPTAIYNYYNQYNTFVPYGGLLYPYPFYQNIQFQSRKNLSKPKERSSEKSTPMKKIIINIS